MSTNNITNVVEFLSEKIATGQLASADITANREGHSEVSLSLVNPVTEFELSNRIKKSLIFVVEKLDYADARRAVDYLLENSNELMKSNPSIRIAGLFSTEHVSIINVAYKQTFHIDHSEKNRSEQEKFKYFIHYLKYFVRHILDTKTINSSGISKVTFVRSTFPHTNFFNDVISIFYKNGEVEIEEFNSNEIGSPHKASNFYSGLFADLNIKLELHFTPEGQYNLYVTFSGSDGSSINLLGDEQMNDIENATSLRLSSNTNDPDFYQYQITGDILFNRFS